MYFFSIFRRFSCIFPEKVVFLQRNCIIRQNAYERYYYKQHTPILYDTTRQESMAVRLIFPWRRDGRQRCGYIWDTYKNDLDVLKQQIEVYISELSNTRDIPFTSAFPYTREQSYIAA